MGIDKNRFTFSNVENFLCGVCKDVAIDPVLTNNCEHYLCRVCIPAHIETCPTCGSRFVSCHEIGLALQRVYLSIKLRCSYVSCEDELTIENYVLHERICPKGVYQCQHSCGFMVHVSLADEIHHHNCISYLIKETERLNDKIIQLGTANSSLQKENIRLNKNEQLLEANNNLLQITLNKNNKRRAKCGIILERGDKYYRCFTCQIRRISAICVDCFEEGNHINHKFVLSEVENDRNYCDCGDSMTLEKGSTCSQHQF